MGATTLPPLFTHLYATDWSDLLADAEYLDRSNEQAVQQLADKIRAAAHDTADDVQSCVENFRVDDDDDPEGA